MRTMKKAELEEALREKDNALGAANLAVMFLAKGTTPDATETFECAGTGDHYTLRLYGSKRFEGGVVVGLVEYDEGKAYTFTSYFDTYVSKYAGAHDEASLPLRCALERMERVRTALLLETVS